MPSKSDVYRQIREIQLKKERIKNADHIEIIERKHSSHRVLTDPRLLCNTNNNNYHSHSYSHINTNLSSTDSSYLLEKILIDAPLGGVFLSENMMV